MSKHSLSVENGHIILTENGRFIVDTGSPCSCALKETELCLGGKKFCLGTGMASMIGKINESILLPQNVDGILGMDILFDNRWQFDFSSSQILVNEKTDPSCKNSIQMDASALGICMKVQINGNVCNAILDTGAFISYISSGIANDVPATGEIDDWNPSIGNIHTTKHSVQLTLGEYKVDVEMGKMPAVLEKKLSIMNILGMMDIRCILGITALGLNSCCLDLKKNRLEF